MISTLATFLLMNTGLGPRTAKAAAWGIVAAAALALLGLAKCTYDARVIERHDAQVTQKTLKTDAAAQAEAADRRAADVIAIEQDERKRNDEISKAAPGRPSDAAVRLGCERLRQAGRDTSGIAACR